MKILYSQIKKLVPELTASPKELGNVLTMLGFMMDGFEEVVYWNKKDYLISLEVRQNRADLLSAIGVAREAAAYWGLEVKMPQPKTKLPLSENSRIKIEACKEVKRVLAITLKNVKNQESPDWLKKYLEFYAINSINLLVDISNYVMILTGYPSHLIDKDKTKGLIRWSMNDEFKEMTTLDKTKLKLGQSKTKEIIIRDEDKILALAGIVGSREASIDLDTKNIIAEIALYDRALIKRNARDLNIITEASNRLEKDLDPEGSRHAFRLLVDMIIEYCGGEINEKAFEYYPEVHQAPTISFDPLLPSAFAGIEIKKEKVLKILKNLRFKIKKGKNLLKVSPPLDRMDISLEEDVIEEVIRMTGYEKIPVSETPSLSVVENITPLIIPLSEKIRDILATKGYDEILSLPLTDTKINSHVNYRDWELITTQNSVNEEFPDLRQSMACGLMVQLDQYLKRNVEHIKIFEIGKIFGKQKDKYEELEALGMLSASDKKNLDLNKFKNDLEALLRQLGFENINYQKSVTRPSISNPYSCWDILVNHKKLGILYKLKPLEKTGNLYFGELNLNLMVEMIKGLKKLPEVELSQKIVMLDANLELPKKNSVETHLTAIKKKLNQDNLWSIRVYDIFELKKENKTRYTIRVSYINMSDKEAKALHLKAFGLKE